MQAGPVMLRRFVRTSKNDPLVDEVELTDINPTYARVRYTDGRESSVSLRDLAPCPTSSIQNGTPFEPQPLQEPLHTSDGLPPAQNSTTTQVPEIRSKVDNAEHVLLTKKTGLGRSTRVRKPAARYG
jgi:hypothetical protein